MSIVPRQNFSLGDFVASDDEQTIIIGQRINAIRISTSQDTATTVSEVVPAAVEPKEDIDIDSNTELTVIYDARYPSNYPPIPTGPPPSSWTIRPFPPPPSPPYTLTTPKHTPIPASASSHEDSSTSDTDSSWDIITTASNSTEQDQMMTEEQQNRNEINDELQKLDAAMAELIQTMQRIAENLKEERLQRVAEEKRAREEDILERFANGEEFEGLDA